MTGTRRESYIVGETEPYTSNFPYNYYNSRNLMTLYTLSEYYKNFGTLQELSENWINIKNILQPYMLKSDWSLCSIGIKNYERRSYRSILSGGMSDSNKQVAGAIGFIRLANLLGDSESINVSIYLLNKALINRLAQDKVVKYLYDTEMITLDPNPYWMAEDSSGLGEGSDARLWRENWTDYHDDPTKPIYYDQFGVFLFDFSTDSYRIGKLFAYEDLTPELGKFLKDYALREAEDWYEAIMDNNLAWFMTFGENYLGIEHSIDNPDNPIQIFNVKAYILDAKAEELEKYIDIPFVELGDYYYIHKLSEIIKAYNGINYSGEELTQLNELIDSKESLEFDSYNLKSIISNVSWSVDEAIIGEETYKKETIITGAITRINPLLIKKRIIVN